MCVCVCACIYIYRGYLTSAAGATSSYLKFNSLNRIWTSSLSLSLALLPARLVGYSLHVSVLFLSFSFARTFRMQQFSFSLTTLISCCWQICVFFQCSPFFIISFLCSIIIICHACSLFATSFVHSINYYYERLETFFRMHIISKLTYENECIHKFMKFK